MLNTEKQVVPLWVPENSAVCFTICRLWPYLSLSFLHLTAVFQEWELRALKDEMKHFSSSPQQLEICRCWPLNCWLLLQFVPICLEIQRCVLSYQTARPQRLTVLQHQVLNIAQDAQVNETVLMCQFTSRHFEDYSWYCHCVILKTVVVSNIEKKHFLGQAVWFFGHTHGWGGHKLMLVRRITTVLFICVVR